MSSAGMKSVFQLGMVVADARKAMGNFRTLFGLGDDVGRYLTTKGILTEAKYRGEDADYVVGIAMVDYAGIQFEWIEPLEGGPNPYREFLDEKGPGLHHIHVLFDDYDAAEQAIFAAGGTEISSGMLGSFGPFQYFDLLDSMALIIEGSRKTSVDYAKAIAGTTGI